MRKYHCPKCGCETFEEVTVDVTVSFRIKNSEDGPEYDEETSSEDGIVDRIQCEKCGVPIQDSTGRKISSMDELAPALDFLGAYSEPEYV